MNISCFCTAFGWKLWSCKLIGTNLSVRLQWSKHPASHYELHKLCTKSFSYNLHVVCIISYIHQCTHQHTEIQLSFIMCTEVNTGMFCYCANVVQEFFVTKPDFSSLSFSILKIYIWAGHFQRGRRGWESSKLRVFHFFVNTCHGTDNYSAFFIQWLWSYLNDI